MQQQIPRTLTIKQTIAQLAIALGAFYVAIQVVGEVHVRNPSSLAIALAVILLLQALLQPIFGALTRLLGLVGILVISLLGNAFIVWLTFVLLPGISVDSFWGSFLTAWLYALLATLVNWILVSQSDDVFLASIVRRKKRAKSWSDTPGFVFIQLDGVPAPVLDWQLKAGNLPNIAKLLAEENYEFRTWRTQLPSTTPASQAGILLGSSAGIPAFRWFEKDTGTLMVANQFSGASLIEKRLSTGDGLLVDGGVSIGNLFSGDAPTNIMVMSRLEKGHESIRSMSRYTPYFYTAQGFMRSLIRSVGEMIKELYQARAQVSRNIQPRVHRHGSYVLLRAATNVLLRDLQTTLVAENMMEGVNSVYVDYLDYDEIAHHAGPARSESLAALSGLDRVVGLLQRIKAYAPRPYHLILVSDHGQSQGRTFSQLHGGKSLEQFVHEYLGGAKVVASTEPIEQPNITLGDKAADTSPEKPNAECVVTGSGNLGNIWLTRYKGRATHKEITRDYPDLLPKLVSTSGVGFVVTHSSAGPLCIGANGTLNLKTSKLTGTDPLAHYPEDTAESLLALAANEHAPDVIVLSSYDVSTGEVHAFEELVGNHGGVGGWQREAILLHPRELAIPKKFTKNGEIHTAESLHKIFKHWIATKTKA